MAICGTVQTTSRRTDASSRLVRSRNVILLFVTVVSTTLSGCGVFGLTDSALWVNEYNGSAWLSFVRVGQTTVGNPSCTTLGGGKVLCAVVGVNNKVTSTVGP